MWATCDSVIQSKRLTYYFVNLKPLVPFYQMTGSIADGLWSASMDHRLQESRGVMRAERGSSSSDHLLAGVRGLGMGVIGGLTSIVTQPIEGASRRGVQVGIDLLTDAVELLSFDDLLTF